jgi:hypothetical protein
MLGNYHNVSTKIDSELMQISSIQSVIIKDIIPAVEKKIGNALKYHWKSISLDDSKMREIIQYENSILHPFFKNSNLLEAKCLLGSLATVSSNTAPTLQ